MLAALTAHGLRPDLVVGSSVGAINSVFFAADPTSDGVRRLENIWRGLRRRDVFPVGVTGLARWVTGRQGHLLSPAALARLLRDHLPVARLEQTVIPACVIATDLLRGAEVRLREGPALGALMASTAIPGLFPPVRVAERLLVDGAVANHTPISTAVALGASRILVLPAGFPCARVDAPQGPLAMALHALNLLTAHQLARDVDRYAAQVHLAVVPPLCPLATAAYEFTSAGEVIDRATAATTTWLEAGGLELASTGAMLTPHHHM